MYVGFIRDLYSDYNKSSALSEASLKHPDLPVAISQGALLPDASNGSWPRQQRRLENNWLVFSVSFFDPLGKNCLSKLLNIFWTDSKLPVDRALDSEFPPKVRLNWALTRPTHIAQGFFPS